MDTNSPGITALIDPLYEAATRPEMWEVFLKKATEALRASLAGVVVHNPANGRTGIRVDLGYTEELRRDVEVMTNSSPWIAEIRKHQATGWYSGSPEDVVKRFCETAFYNDFHRKHKIGPSIASIVFGPGGSMPGLVVSREETGKPFSTTDKKLMKSLVPHLGRVFKVYRELSDLQEQNAVGQHALDLLGAACITLDGCGRVLSMNRRAETLIADGRTLRMKARRLLAAQPPEQCLLDTCVLAACACGAGKSDDPGVGAVVLHSGQDGALYLSVLPYRSSWTVLDNRPAALLFIAPPESQGQGEHRLWQTMFGLSPAECRVAEMMKRGLEVAEISEAMRIRVDTVRYYQKSTYRKAGVRGQVQLVRLLTMLPSSCQE